MSTLCLTGWQQPADALSSIVPADAIHADYSAFTDVQSFFATLPDKVDVAIGWSLGGQLLARAIAEKHVRARRVILLGAPYQFLASLLVPQGMPAHMMEGVIANYRKDPQGMLGEFCSLIAAGDEHAARIARTLREVAVPWKNGMFWLKELGRFSCTDLDFTGFPPTTIIHGDGDKVIYPAQAELYAGKIRSADVRIWKGCGHAPHLHNTKGLQDIINAYV